MKKVFFDLDGTLLNVEDRNYKVYSELVAEFGGVSLSQAVYWDLKRKKTKWPELLPKSELSPSIQADFLDSFIKRIEDPEYLKLDRLFPESLEVVKAIAGKRDAEGNKEFSCDLVSLRRNEANLLQQLSSLGLSQYFDKVLSGHSETDGFDKKIELISGRLGDNEGIIMGDTEADIVAGQQLHLTTIALTSGIRDEQFLRDLNPDYLESGIGRVLGLPPFNS